MAQRIETTVPSKTSGFYCDSITSHGCFKLRSPVLQLMDGIKSTILPDEPLLSRYFHRDVHRDVLTFQYSSSYVSRLADGCRGDPKAPSQGLTWNKKQT